MKTKTKPRAKKRAGSKGSTKKSQAKRIIITSVAVAAAGVLGYFGWKYIKARKDKKNGIDQGANNTGLPSTDFPADIPVYTPPVTTPKPKSSGGSYSPPRTINNSGGFPLKKGSKGDKVRALQLAIISKYGKSYLPKYGVDGDFGSETVNALKRAGLPASIDESTFNVLVGDIKTPSTDIGSDLHKAAFTGNYSKALSLLKLINTVEEYSAANETFKKNRLKSVRQTIVNGLLNIFSKPAQKDAIKREFLRMGLQFDGSKWSLSGFDGRAIVTHEATTVWVNATDGVKVPARMVLGNEVSRRLDYTLFANRGRYFLVTTKSVQYLS